jgi:hypothetical protein
VQLSGQGSGTSGRDGRDRHAGSCRRDVQEVLEVAVQSRQGSKRSALTCPRDFAAVLLVVILACLLGEAVARVAAGPWLRNRSHESCQTVTEAGAACGHDLSVPDAATEIHRTGRRHPASRGRTDGGPLPSLWANTSSVDQPVRAHQVRARTGHKPPPTPAATGARPAVAGIDHEQCRKWYISAIVVDDSPTPPAEEIPRCRTCGGQHVLREILTRRSLVSGMPLSGSRSRTWGQ